MRKTVLGSILGCLLTLFAIFTVFALRGAQAAPPGKWEARIVNSAKHRFLVGGKSAINPLPANAVNISAGRQNFAHYCFACHGLDGQGTGVPFFETISPPVPTLASPSVQSYTDGQLFWVIKNGLWPSGMPAAKGILDDDELWSLVLYIRHLPPAGSLGEPAAYTDSCPPPASPDPE